MSGNKLFKGAVAGAAGVALLAGGFGSFALWSDQQALPSTEIKTGQLGLTAATATYTDESPDNGGDTSWEPGTDEMVPGDVVRVAIPLTVAAEGKNLDGDLDFVQPVGFGGELTVSYDIVLADSDSATDGVQAESWVTRTTADAPVIFDAGTGDGSFDATGYVTFALASTATFDQAQNATVALNEAAFKVSQTR